MPLKILSKKEKNTNNSNLEKQKAKEELQHKRLETQQLIQINKNEKTELKKRQLLAELEEKNKKKRIYIKY